MYHLYHLHGSERINELKYISFYINTKNLILINNVKLIKKIQLERRPVPLEY